MSQCDFWINQRTESSLWSHPSKPSALPPGQHYQSFPHHFDSSVCLLAVLWPVGLGAPENKRHKEYASVGAEMSVRIDGRTFE